MILEQSSPRAKEKRMNLMLQEALGFADRRV
jgi:hypothetical protein